MVTTGRRKIVLRRVSEVEALLDARSHWWYEELHRLKMAPICGELLLTRTSRMHTYDHLNDESMGWETDIPPLSLLELLVTFVILLAGTTNLQLQKYPTSPLLPDGNW